MPSSPSADHNAGEYPTASFSSLRTTSVPECLAHVRRTDSRSSSCSGVKSMSTAGLLGLPLRALAGPRIVVGCRGQSDPGGAGGADAFADGEGDVDLGPPAAAVVDRRAGHRAGHRHRVAGEHRVLYPERDLAESATRAGPVGEVAL